MKIPKNRVLDEVEFAVDVKRPDCTRSRIISSRNFTLTYDADFIYVGPRFYPTSWVVGFELKPVS